MFFGKKMNELEKFFRSYRMLSHTKFFASSFFPLFHILYFFCTFSTFIFLFLCCMFFSIRNLYENRKLYISSCYTSKNSRRSFLNSFLHFLLFWFSHFLLFSSHEAIRKARETPKRKLKEQHISSMSDHQRIPFFSFEQRSLILFFSVSKYSMDDYLEKR